jgi:hypothetical protein
MPTQSNYASYQLALHSISNTPPSDTDRTSFPAHDPTVHINNMYSRNSPKPYASFSPSDYIHDT